MGIKFGELAARAEQFLRNAAYLRGQQWVQFVEELPVGPPADDVVLAPGAVLLLTPELIDRLLLERRGRVVSAGWEEGGWGIDPGTGAWRAPAIGELIPQQIAQRKIATRIRLTAEAMAEPKESPGAFLKAVRDEERALARDLGVAAPGTVAEVPQDLYFISGIRWTSLAEVQVTYPSKMAVITGLTIPPPSGGRKYSDGE